MSCSKRPSNEVRVAFSLIPRSEHFFDDFVGLSEEIRGGAKLLKQMMSSDPPDMTKADAIKDVEHACDGRTRAIVDSVNRTFVTPLDRDLFTTTDFYRDAASWSDPRYFRCNSPSTLQAMWGADAANARPMIGTTPPASASWGHCEIDYPRDAIVSPYPFASAEAHYEALLAETAARGGPTVYSRERPPPDWNGR